MASKINFSVLTTDKYKKIKNFEILYNFTETKFGPCIIGTNNNQLCYAGFYNEGKENLAIDLMIKDWPNATVKEDADAVDKIATNIFKDVPDDQIDVLLKGTDLQVAVWKELVNIKSGTTVSYEDVAKAIGKPTAIRAVASAIGKNRIAYFIPCHRVIQKSGGIGKYGWGIHLKQKMLHAEKGKC